MGIVNKSYFLLAWVVATVLVDTVSHDVTLVCRFLAHSTTHHAWKFNPLTTIVPVCTRTQWGRCLIGCTSRKLLSCQDDKYAMCFAHEWSSPTTPRLAKFGRELFRGAFLWNLVYLTTGDWRWNILQLFCSFLWFQTSVTDCSAACGLRLSRLTSNRNFTRVPQRNGTKSAAWQGQMGNRNN